MPDAVQQLVAALAAGEVEVVDLTQPLSEQTPILRLPEPFANTPRFRLRELSRYDDRGPAWYWNAFEGGGGAADGGGGGGGGRPRRGRGGRFRPAVPLPRLPAGRRQVRPHPARQPGEAAGHRLAAGRRAAEDRARLGQPRQGVRPGAPRRLTAPPAGQAASSGKIGLRRAREPGSCAVAGRRRRI